MPHQKSHQLDASAKTPQRGFTFAEKWIIWSVLCLLLALSTHWLIFPGLQFLAWGIVRWRWQAQHRVPLAKRYIAIIAFMAGLVLAYGAIVLLRA